MPILILWILIKLNAPIWTYILWGIALMIKLYDD